MATAKVYSASGEQTGERALPDKLFEAPVKPYRVHQYVKTYLANQRQGTQSTLTRAEVRGGGGKPWRQKGTGRARVGTIRSPLWEGGGVIFAPKPRDYYSRVPKKMKRQALVSAFTMKAKEDRLMVVEEPQLDKPKTGTMVKLFNSLQIAGKRVLLLHEGRSNNLELSCRNIPGVTCKRAALANTYDIVAADYLLITEAGIKECEEVFGK
jgi:large subunit ribosomal protein L4